MTTARVALECAALAALLYAVCFVVGWWLWRLCATRIRSVSVWTGAPIAGLAISMTVAYYWASHGGLDVIAPWIVIGALVVDGAVLFRSRRELRIGVSSLRRAVWPALVAATATLLFSWNHIDTFRIGRLSTGSLFLADLANFSIIGDLLARRGFGSPGSIVGFDVGSLAAVTPGSSMFLGLASSWTGRLAFEVTLPVALLCVVLVALSARDLARLVLPWSQLLPALIAIAASGASILVYAVAQFALSQLLVMSSAIALLAIVAETALWQTSRPSITRSASVAICLAPLVLAYPHMAVLGPPLLVGIALAAAIGRSWWTRAGTALSVAAGGVVLAALVLPHAARTAIDRVALFGGASAGFPLTLLTPIDLLGFRSTFVGYADEPNAVALFVLESLAIAAIATCVVVAARGKSRARVALGAAAAVGALASYAAVLVSKGASYTQWKWASFFVPIFVVGVGSMFSWACMLVARHRSSARRRLAPGIAVATAAAVVVGGAVFAHEATQRFVGESGGRAVTVGWNQVDRDLITIASGPAYDGVRAVNVEVPEYWESLWAASFLAPRRTYLSGGFGVVAVAPGARWTLERNNLRFVHPPQSDVRVVNGAYRLVRERPDRVKQGALWVVGSCDGLYRFDGTRWLAVERTRKTGGFRLTMTPEPARPSTRAPVIVHARSAVDALLLEFLPRDRARFVTVHRGVQLSGPDRRLVPHREVTEGRPFDLEPGRPMEIDVVFDPITGEERVTRGAETLFEARNTFLVPPRMGKVRVGSNSSALAPSDRKFPGQLEVLDTTTPVCDDLPQGT
ncbi:MAG TPA: hypothetical protein VIH82_10930 [Acidimicrobiia bacterium]|jgi:hypothetical protein